MKIDAKAIMYSLHAESFFFLCRWKSYINFVKFKSNWELEGDPIGVFFGKVIFLEVPRACCLVTIKLNLNF